MKFASLALLGAAALHAGVYFEPNRGQADSRAPFVARTARGPLALSAQRLELLRRDGRREWIRLAGARPDALATPEAPAPGVSHYALDHDPARWIWDVPHYSRVRFRGVYPGVDVLYHSEKKAVEFDFLLDAGADPARLGLEFSEPARLTASGALAVGLATLHAPAAWQVRDGRRIPVEVRFAPRGANRIAFRLGRYDRALPLTIDPIVEFATFLGGSDDEHVTGMVVGPDGAIYVAGSTLSADFPAALPDGDLLNRPEVLLAPDVFVARLKPDASALDWSLFLGGTLQEEALGLKRDELGNLYLLGRTGSPNFPVTPGAYRSRIHPSLADLFVVKLDAQSGRIKTSTFLGIGQPGGSGGTLAVDSTGGIYVTGLVSDNSVQTTPGAYQPAPALPDPSGVAHGFILRMNAAASAVVYATLFDAGRVTATAVDSGGNLVMGGVATAFPQPDALPFPIVHPIPNVNQRPSFLGQAFVAALNASGTALIFSSLLHGDGGGSGISDVKIAQDGSIQVLGFTDGAAFPQVNPLLLDPVPATFPSPGRGSPSAPFWARLPAAGGSLIQSTLFYGPQFSIRGFAQLLLAPDRPACLVGVGTNRLEQSPGGLVGGQDPLNRISGSSIACVNADGTALALKTLLPDAGGDYTSAALTPDGAVLFAGGAGPGLVTTPNVMQPVFGGSVTHDRFFPYPIPDADGFVLRMSFNNPAPKIQAIAPDSILLEPAATGTRNVEVVGSGFAYGADLAFNGQPVSGTFLDSGHITLTGVAIDKIQPGANRITISIPGPGGGTAEATLSGVNATPNGVAVSPSFVTQGAGETKLVIRATNLSKDSTLYWNGQPRAAQFVADGVGRQGHFELVLPASEVAQPLSVVVAVGNPGPGGGLSPETVFRVQPAAGALAPVLLETRGPLLFGGTVPVFPTLVFNGRNFTSATRAFWDGVEIPVELASATGITVRPPEADMNRWGAHDFYVMDGALRSATLRLFIAREVPVAVWVSDPVRQRVYVLTAPEFAPAPHSDLLTLDLATGKLLATVAAAAIRPVALALSSDGRYLYLADALPSATLKRYNTATNTFDLQWPEDNGTSNFYPLSLLTVPGSPETLIVSNNVGVVTIFDRDQPRLFDSTVAGFPAGNTGVFATASRIYLNHPSSVCWQWMDFDASGILSGSAACHRETPADAVDDGNLIYLTDGQRNLAVSAPFSASINGDPQNVALLADPAHRHAYQLVTSFGVMTLTEFNLDTGRQQVKAQLSGFFNNGQKALDLGPNGSVLVAASFYIALVP